VSTSPAADVIVGLCTLGSAVLGYAGAHRAQITERVRARRAAAEEAGPVPVEDVALPEPPAELPAEPTAVYTRALGLYETALATAEADVAWLRDRIARIADLAAEAARPEEGQPRMPLRRAKHERGRRKVRAGDTYTIDDELAADGEGVELEQVTAAAEPSDPAAEVNDQELTDEEYG
jgi:hypothetical protein